ncbi:MAG: asparaginase [Thermoanaerobaculia bacterium]|nr:asparaginase [Thermoanaerobaculia bacterium]
MRKVTLITTGGTIEKTYDEQTGELENRRSIVHRMLEELRLDDTRISVLELMSKDSLEMTAADRKRVVEAVGLAGAEGDEETSGIVILHGTDTLQQTGERLEEAFPAPAIPIVLTGAWRPYEMKRSDALQNLTESLFAAGNLPPGVYCVAHGRALAFPGVTKDHDRSTFVRREDR